MCDEMLGSEFGRVQVSARDARATNADFAYLAFAHRFQPGVQKENFRVHRTADWNIFQRLLAVTAPDGGERCFGETVKIIELRPTSLGEPSRESLKGDARNGR